MTVMTLILRRLLFQYDEYVWLRTRSISDYVSLVMPRTIPGPGEDEAVGAAALRQHASL